MLFIGYRDMCDTCKFNLMPVGTYSLKTEMFLDP